MAEVLDAIRKIEVLDLHPGDTLVLTVDSSDRSALKEMAQQLDKYITSRFVDVKVLVIPRTMELKILRGPSTREIDE